MSGARSSRSTGCTALQEQIPPELLSRVSAYDALGSYALGPVGTILAGPLALAVGAAVVLGTGGGIIVATALVVLCVSDVRQLTRHERVPADTVDPVDAHQ